VNAHIVVMGVAGCGKSTVGQALAARLERPFVEGDAFHTDAARAKMAAGVALTDADRAPWLAALSTLLRTSPTPVVLACSALKQAYRDRLAEGGVPLRFVWLDASPDLMRARLESRPSHHFDPALIESQFATLEPTANALRLDATLPVAELVTLAARWIATDQR
jgi:carbohydrate kinase (thermoresistant glucokinase family)